MITAYKKFNFSDFPPGEKTRQFGWRLFIPVADALVDAMVFKVFPQEKLVTVLYFRMKHFHEEVESSACFLILRLLEVIEILRINMCK